MQHARVRVSAYAVLVTFLAVGAFLIVVAAFVFLAFRWTKPRPSAPDMRRADEAEAKEQFDAKTMRERVFMYMSIYGPKK